MVIVYHEPVLSKEALHFLCTDADGIYVDCTLGGGGHAAQILQQGSPRRRLIGIDRDADAIQVAQEHLRMFGDRVTYVQGNFVLLREYLEKLGISKVNGMLLDLGVSSHQINEVNRGFSFQSNTRIDMRMSQNQQVDGWTVVNTFDEPQLAEVFWKFGEERFSRKIARRIIEQRANHSIDTTEQLAQVVESVVGQRMLTKSLARIFQAIRIEVNDELENLERVLQDAVETLEIGGRLVVISYHSLEDRIVKQFIRNQAHPEDPMSKFMQHGSGIKPLLQMVTKKPVVATEEEIRRNPRARSAKLRAAERI